MTKINLEAIDTDGAVREAADAVAGDTRLSFMKKAGLTTGGALAGGSLLGLLVADGASAATSGRPPASFGKADVGILNYALTLEYLESAFYTEAKNSGAIKDPQTQAFLQVVEKDERTHVAALKKALGSKAVKKPTFDFQGTNKDETLFKKTAQVLENTGVHAYFGQGFNIKSPAVLAVAVSILTVEARHAGAIGSINGGVKNIAPDGAFDTPFTAAKVLAAVKKTGFIKS